jgi:ASC-1-like (ASCH) protein
MDKKIKPKQLRFRAVDRDIFEAVKNGTKKVETRAASPKFFGIKAGEIIILKCGQEKIEKKVKKAEIFKGPKELLLKYELSLLGPGLCSKEDLEKMYHSFPGYDQKIKKYGLIALELSGT